VGGKFPSPPAPCSKQPDCNRVEVASPGRQSRLSARIQLCWDRFPTRLNLLVVLPQWPPNGARPPIGAQPSTAAHRSSATRGRPTGLSQHDYQSPCGSPWGSANSGRHPANATGILSPPTSTCSTLEHVNRHIARIDELHSRSHEPFYWEHMNNSGISRIQSPPVYHWARPSLPPGIPTLSTWWSSLLTLHLLCILFRVHPCPSRVSTSHLPWHQVIVDVTVHKWHLPWYSLVIRQATRFLQPRRERASALTRMVYVLEATYTMLRQDLTPGPTLTEHPWTPQHFTPTSLSTTHLHLIGISILAVKYLSRAQTSACPNRR